MEDGLLFYIHINMYDKDLIYIIYELKSHIKYNYN